MININICLDAYAVYFLISSFFILVIKFFLNDKKYSHSFNKVEFLFLNKNTINLIK